MGEGATLVDGHSVLRDLTAYIHYRHPKIPVFLDCKIGDIDNTMTAYLRTAFELLKVEGMLINPYMGDEVLRPFSALPNKIGIVLVKTSNCGARIIQDIQTMDGRPLWKRVLDLVIHRWNDRGNLIPVLSADCPPTANELRMGVPDETIIFVAGCGAQGGTAGQVRDFLNSSSAGGVVNSSRALLSPYRASDPEWRSAIRRQVRGMRNNLNEARVGRTSDQ